MDILGGAPFESAMRIFVVPAVIMVFSFAVIWAAFQLDESPAMIVGDSMQPRVFPIFLMCFNLVLAGFLALAYRKEPPAVIELEGFQTWGSIGLFVVFYFLTVHADMMIAITVVMFAMCVLWGERRIHIAAATAIATPVLVFFLFDLVLRVRFPRGLLTNWYYG